MKRDGSFLRKSDRDSVRSNGPRIEKGANVMTNQLAVESELLASRRDQDRRESRDRRTDDAVNEFDGTERRRTSRRKVERRRQIDPTTCERDYTDDEIEFMKEMDDYKRRSGRQFPTWSEVLEVLGCMGYRRVAEPTELKF